MKKLTKILLFFLSSQLFSNELAWVDEQVNAIKPPRKGINTKKISHLKDPFIYLKTKKRIKRTFYRKSRYSKSTSKKVHTYSSLKPELEAILNKSALINGKWYKEGEKVYGYKIEKVNFKTVLLSKGEKQLLLSTMSKNKNLKFNNK